MNKALIDSTLFVSDLDGTLLDDCSRVSPETASMLNRLIAEGVKFTCATARTPATVTPLLSAIKSDVPSIVMTGASLWDRHRLSYISPRLMDRDVAREVVAIARENGINPFIYTLGGDDCRMMVYHNGLMSRGEQRFVDERRHLDLKHFVLDSPRGLEPYLEGTILMFAMGPVDKIFTVAAKLRGGVDCSVSAYIDIFGPSTGILEVFGSGISKAAAIKQLAAGMGRERIVVFGDNLNDIPMMEIATESYAVANALPEVKAAATATIGSNLHSAVPRHIATLCDIPLF